jgi:hypothetical protein
MKILRLLVVLLLLMSSVAAMTNDERTWEAKKAVVSINTLMPDKFQSFEVQVDENNSMNVWFTYANSNYLSNCLSGILGAYHSACLTQPDMGGLNIYIGSKEKPLYAMYCTKAESNAIWIDLKTVDNNLLANLISKLVTNAVNLNPMYKQSFAGPTAAWADVGNGSQGGSDHLNILGPNAVPEDDLPVTPLGIGW